MVYSVAGFAPGCMVAYGCVFVAYVDDFVVVYVVDYVVDYVVGYVVDGCDADVVCYLFYGVG